MKRFAQGDSRTQSFLLPEALDDYVTDTNPVRVVDVFVDELDLQKLGFEGVEPALTGRPSYQTAFADWPETASDCPKPWLACTSSYSPCLCFLDEMQARLDHSPEMMRIRRQTVEHPFGIIKAWMGATHFLTRTIERVSTEMSLHVLAYNMKRVITLLGSEAVMKAMRA